MTTPQRIIDANANRVREALRVLEEAARFIVQDPALSQTLKQMRHDFSQALPNTLELIAHRDTPGDVGTSITTAAEQTRSDLPRVIAAAGSRLSEALRAIEEYSKLAELSPGFHHLASVAETVRYQSYDVTQRLIFAVGSRRAPQWRLCLLLTQSLCKLPWRNVLEVAIEHGADCIQVREKDMDAGPLLDHIGEVIDLVASSADVIVNDRPDLAKLAGADGVHLGQSDLDPDDARKIVGSQLLIGVSTSNLDEAQAAQANGADYCGVGPMFPTTTKHKPNLAGPAYLREYLQNNGLPHLAIGGINASNLNELIEAGVQGIAISSAICAADDPGQVTAGLITAIKASTAAK
ncbi:MAG: thiamine phosphate synthase [Phycisphaeraceae bacterium]